MSSPDTTPYNDLRVFDMDPQRIFETAIAELLSTLPSWRPRESNTEVLLMEALAMEVAESIFAINRLPDGIVEVLLRLFGLERSNGAAPIAQLQFNMVNGAGYTIPAGTQARLALDGYLEPVVFTTDVQLSIPPGFFSGVVQATGNRFTTDANGADAGTQLEYLDSIIEVEYIDLAEPIVGGADPETDVEYFSRGTTRLSRLTDTLVLPSHFSALALEQSYISRVAVVDNWDGESMTPGDDAGHITLAAYGDNRLLTDLERDALTTLLDTASLANLAVHVVDPVLNVVNVAVTVKAFPSHDSAAVIAAVTTALDEYLSPMTWEWGSVVRYTELVTLISNVEGVDYLVTMTPSSDVTMSGFAPLADLGTVAVTVM